MNDCVAPPRYCFEHSCPKQPRQENTSNIHKPFMDIVKNIETIYTTRIRLLQKREVNVGYSSGRYNATPI